MCSKSPACSVSAAKPKPINKGHSRLSQHLMQQPPDLACSGQNNISLRLIPPQELLQ